MSAFAIINKTWPSNALDYLRHCIKGREAGEYLASGDMLDPGMIAGFSFLDLIIVYSLISEYKTFSPPKAISFFCVFFFGFPFCAFVCRSRSVLFCLFIFFLGQKSSRINSNPVCDDKGLAYYERKIAFLVFKRYGGQFWNDRNDALYTHFPGN